MQSLLRSSQTTLQRFLPCARRLIPPAGRSFILRLSTSSFSQGRERQERDDYYNLILSSSLKKSPTSPLSSPAAIGGPKNNKRRENSYSSSHQKVIFGSRLAGPAAARQKEGWAQERPPEPDNCCMSGCVNCVWDAYREEVEEWAAKGRLGKTSVIDVRAAQGQGGGTTDTEGLDRLRTKEFQSEGLFEGVPVGIREFMALEKRLREREVGEEGKG